MLNFENKDTYCFIWSKLAQLHPCNNSHPNRVSNYKQYFNDLNINGFDFSKGFKSSDVHKLRKHRVLLPLWISNETSNVMKRLQTSRKKKEKQHFFQCFLTTDGREMRKIDMESL